MLLPNPHSLAVVAASVVGLAGLVILGDLVGEARRCASLVRFTLEAGKQEMAIQLWRGLRASRRGRAICALMPKRLRRELRDLCDHE